MDSLTALIDTDVAIDVWRAYPPALAWLRQRTAHAVLLPGYSAMEVVAGCRDGRELRSALQFLESFRLIWLTRESSGNAFALLSRQRLGSGTGIIDTFIAQTALDLNLPLHTFNVKHFRAIPGLTILQPYERD